MAHKFKIKGKTYTLLEEMDVIDNSIIKRRAKVADSKGVVFTYIHLQDITYIMTKTSV